MQNRGVSYSTAFITIIWGGALQTICNQYLAWKKLFSIFGQKIKKSYVLPLMALLRFLEGTFSGPIFFQIDLDLWEFV